MNERGKFIFNDIIEKKSNRIKKRKGELVRKNVDVKSN